MSHQVERAHWDGAAFGRRTPDHPAVVAFSSPKVELVRRALAAAPGELSLLEVGAGNGFLSRPLEGLFRLTTLDLSRNMLAAGSCVSSARVQARAERLPFRDRAFDVALSANLLHHLDSPIAAVREMARIARRHVVIIEPNALNPLMALFGAVAPRERGTLKFTARYTRELGGDANLKLRVFATQGAVVPNKTPEPALPLLRWLDAPNPLGFYHVAVFDV